MYNSNNKKLLIIMQLLIAIITFLTLVGEIYIYRDLQVTKENLLLLEKMNEEVHRDKEHTTRCRDKSGGNRDKRDS